MTRREETVAEKNVSKKFKGKKSWERQASNGERLPEREREALRKKNLEGRGVERGSVTSG